LLAHTSESYQDVTKHDCTNQLAQATVKRKEDYVRLFFYFSCQSYALTCGSRRWWCQTETSRASVWPLAVFTLSYTRLRFAHNLKRCFLHIPMRRSFVERLGYRRNKLSSLQCVILVNRFASAFPVYHVEQGLPKGSCKWLGRNYPVAQQS
jgi:hypothetical protein